MASARNQHRASCIGTLSCATAPAAGLHAAFQEDPAGNLEPRACPPARRFGRRRANLYRGPARGANNHRYESISRHYHGQMYAYAPADVDWIQTFCAWL